MSVLKEINEMNVKDLIGKKDEENAIVNEITLDVFENIKDELLNDLIERSIEYNYESIHVFDTGILKAAAKHLGFDPYVHLYVRNYGLFVGDNNLSTGLTLGSDPDIQATKSFISKLNYSLLTEKLCSYFESKGFKARVTTHRFTGERGKLMQFQTTKQKLLNNEKPLLSRIFGVFK